MSMEEAMTAREIAASVEREHLFSDAMDAAANAFVITRHGIQRNADRAGEPNDGEKTMRRALQAAIIRYIEESDVLTAYGDEAQAAEIGRLMASPPPDGAERSWRCFHCDEVFTTRECALEHFGSGELSTPACGIDIAEYRRMEELHERHLAEDSDADRQFYAMQADHAVALRREEEKGYARGIDDIRDGAEALVKALDMIRQHYTDDQNAFAGQIARAALDAWRKR